MTDVLPNAIVREPMVGQSVPLRAALYARVSSAEQAQGYSIVVQLESLRQFAAHNRYTVGAST